MLGLSGSYNYTSIDSKGKENNLYFYPISPIIGWKKIMRNSFYFRAYLNPIVNDKLHFESYTLPPYIYLSLGYCF